MHYVVMEDKFLMNHCMVEKVKKMLLDYDKRFIDSIGSEVFFAGSEEECKDFIQKLDNDLKKGFLIMNE